MGISLLNLYNYNRPVLRNKKKYLNKIVYLKWLLIILVS